METEPLYFYQPFELAFQSKYGYYLSVNSLCLMTILLNNLILCYFYFFFENLKIVVKLMLGLLYRDYMDHCKVESFGY